MQKEHFVQCFHGCHTKNIHSAYLLNKLCLRKTEQIHLLIFVFVTGSKYILPDRILIDVVDLQPCFDLLCAGDHTAGHTGQTGYIDTKAFICTAGDDLSEEDDFFAMLFHRDAIVNHPFKVSLQLGKLVVVGGKKCLCAAMLCIRQIFDRCPGNTKTVKSTCTTADLIQNDQ